MALVSEADSDKLANTAKNTGCKRAHVLQRLDTYTDTDEPSTSD